MFHVHVLRVRVVRRRMNLPIDFKIRRIGTTHNHERIQTEQGIIYLGTECRRRFWHLFFFLAFYHDHDERLWGRRLSPG